MVCGLFFPCIFKFVGCWEVFILMNCLHSFDIYYQRQDFELWERGRRKQSRLQRNEWINLTLSSAALSAIMAPVLNAACKHSLTTCKECVPFMFFNIHPKTLDQIIFLWNHSGNLLIYTVKMDITWCEAHIWGSFDSDMKNLIGEASCRICQESFSTTVTGLFQFTVWYLWHRFLVKQLIPVGLSWLVQCYWMDMEMGNS